MILMKNNNAYCPIKYYENNNGIPIYYLLSYYTSEDIKKQLHTVCNIIIVLNLLRILLFVL